MDIQLTYHRRHTTTTKVGNLEIGSEHPVRVQTMANTSTNDIDGSVAQANRCFAAGAELLRYTTQGMREVESLAQIRKAVQEFSSSGVTPLVADVHFQSDVADAAAKVVEKVRINPGNYIDPARKFKQIDYTDEEYQTELERLRNRFVQLLDICKEHKTALRIGVNHGSLSDRIMSRYGDTPEGMVESCMEFLRVAVAEDFKDIVLSIKASNTRVMVTTVRLLVWQMAEENMAFPLHLGVTEAGEGEDGRVKSAVGIGALLADGIGDTIRVSLSEAPEKELPVAKALVDYFADEQQSIRYAPTTQVKVEGSTVYYSNEDTDWATFQLHAAAECGRLLWDYNCTELILNNEHFAADDLIRLSKDILQAARVRMYKTEYISCPGCGRTLFDLEQTIAEVKAATAHLQGLKIGIMGCIVNGPGEMADADYGYVGSSPEHITLYRGRTIVERNIHQSEALDHLINIIKSDGRWHDPE